MYERNTCRMLRCCFSEYFYFIYNRAKKYSIPTEATAGIGVSRMFWFKGVVENFS